MWQGTEYTSVMLELLIVAVPAKEALKYYMTGVWREVNGCKTLKMREARTLNHSLGPSNIIDDPSMQVGAG